MFGEKSEILVTPNLPTPPSGSTPDNDHYVSSTEKVGIFFLKLLEIDCFYSTTLKLFQGNKYATRSRVQFQWLQWSKAFLDHH